MITLTVHNVSVNPDRDSSCAWSFKVPAVIVVLILCAHLAYALGVSVSWRENREDDIAGYRVHYGTSSRYYQHSLDVGPYTSVDIDDLRGGVTYYVAVSAYDYSGNESDYSQEVEVTIPLHAFGEGWGEGGGSCFVSVASNETSSPSGHL